MQQKEGFSVMVKNERILFSLRTYLNWKPGILIILGSLLASRYSGRGGGGEFMSASLPCP